MEDLPFWARFFSELSIPFRTSEQYKDSLKTGKKIAGAEFCAPIDSMYGHISYLAKNYDLVFMPVYLESRSKPKDNEENFCYYTQFSASLAFQEGEEVRNKLLSPMLNFHKNGDHNTEELYTVLVDAGYKELKSAEVSAALRNASQYAASIRDKLKKLYEKQDLRMSLASN